MFQIIGAMAEFERALIQERVRAGLRNARAKGSTTGEAARDCGRLQDCLSARAGTFVESDHCRDEDWQGNSSKGA
jgi:hypothetical protein